MADRFRPKLIELLAGEGQGRQVCRGFEVCEYGTQPLDARIDEDLPVLRCYN